MKESICEGMHLELELDMHNKNPYLFDMSLCVIILLCVKFEDEFFIRGE